MFKIFAKAPPKPAVSKPKNDAYPSWVAYEPNLIPPPSLMHTEGITVIEEWFRWAEEWSCLLRMYGGLAKQSRVLEISCGLGRTAFPLPKRQQQL